MTRERGTADTFLGHSGQMAVMAELLARRCNVSKPDVDLGTDVFAFLDHRSEIARIQVKSAQAKRYKKKTGYVAKFDIPLAQLQTADEPPLHYVLATRLEEQWVSFLIIDRGRMQRYRNSSLPFGTDNALSGNLALTVRFQDRILSQAVDLTSHWNAWDLLPPLRVSSGPTGT